MEATIITILIIAIVFMAFALRSYSNSEHYQQQRYNDLRKEYNNIYMSWIDEKKLANKYRKESEIKDGRIFSLNQIIEINEAQIINLKKANISLRLSRNGVRGRYIQLLAKERESTELYIGWCKNQAEKIVDLNKQIEDLTEKLKQSNEFLISSRPRAKQIDQLPKLSPTDDLPIGTKFVYNGCMLEVKLGDSGRCSYCKLVKEKCGKFKCTSKERTDGYSVYFKQI